jgi:hypothetical protein
MNCAHDWEDYSITTPSISFSLGVKITRSPMYVCFKCSQIVLGEVREGDAEAAIEACRKSTDEYMAKK